MPTTIVLTTTAAYGAPRAGAPRTPRPYNRAGNRLTEASTITGTWATGLSPPASTRSTASRPRVASFSTLGSAFDAVPNRTTLVTLVVPVTTTFDPPNWATGGDASGAERGGHTAAK